MSKQYYQAAKSFLGHLQGTSKALQTIESYQGDLRSFELFMKESFSGKTDWLKKIDDQLFKNYSDYLEHKKVKSNTQRRKLLTLQKFLRYLAARKKVSQSLAKKFPAPLKVEKTPLVVDLAALLEQIKALPVESHLDSRNRLLMWVLAETGCQVSEVTHIRFQDIVQNQISISGKAERTLTISTELMLAVFDHQQFSQGNEYLFRGFSRLGALPEPLSDRGVELLVKHYAGMFKCPKLTPRLFRRSIVMQWFQQGVSEAEIQKRLGLKSAYAFKVYAPLFAKSAQG